MNIYVFVFLKSVFLSLKLVSLCVPFTEKTDLLLTTVKILNASVREILNNNLVFPLA